MSTVLFDVYRETVSLLTAPVTMTVLLTVGYDLSLRKDMIFPVLKESLIRLAVMALSAALILLVFRKQLTTLELKTAVVLYFSLPPQFITPILIQDDKERTFTATMISFYVLITVIAFVIIAVYTQLYIF